MKNRVVPLNLINKIQVGLEEPEKLVDIYIKVYKEGLGINYFKQQEQ